MPRSVVLLIVGILIVLFLGFVAGPWLKNNLFGNKMDVRVNPMSAVIDDKVNVPGSTDVVSRIVVEMEILFPYGSAPDNLSELSFRADDGSTVDLNWGNIVERKDIEDRSMTRWYFPEVFFPTDFRQGWLQNKNRDLNYFRMPKLPHNAPSPRN